MKDIKNWYTERIIWETFGIDLKIVYFVRFTSMHNKLLLHTCSLSFPLSTSLSFSLCLPLPLQKGIKNVAIKRKAFKTATNKIIKRVCKIALTLEK